ncbi:hypothetical protein [Stappia sp. 28M-7]|uniref:hypothetical protein n=1 Tax=Stappia sp. 28M-7 TaxID=2762596 RepID=UPI00163C3033|nr:hypothetical protein [Stappia sp. 28M-7]MBC2858724.1 hypothetical protein [Stappia sp. 28M-7]
MATAAGASALAVLVRASINSADTMSKAAQRAGVTTEALSRLAWAGELSDVSLGSLSGGMARLTNVMAQVASGADKTSAAIFRSLGIAVTDAEGNLRGADQVMIDLADRFARMENGANKTALAIKLFGRSGAELIPLLNNGRQGLADMAAESDRLGKTISTEFGKRAEVFNDTMTRIWAAGAGLVNQLAEAVLPQLQDFADMLADPQFVENAKAMAQGIAGAFQIIVDSVNAVTSAMRWLDTVAGDVLYAVAPPDPDAVKRWKEFRDQLSGNGLSPGAFDRRWTLPPTRTDKEDTPPGDKFDWSGIGSSQKAADAAERQREALNKLIQSLHDELGVLSASSTVQQEMIRHRETLAESTPKERKAVEDLIGSIERERTAKADLREYNDILKGSVSSLAMAVRNGENVWDALADNALRALDRITDKILNDVLDAVFQLNGASGGGDGGGGLLGGLFSNLFGGGSSSSSLFSGFYAKGGLIPNGTFGIVGERGPEPVIGTPQGAKVLPNSSLRSIGSGGGTEVNIYNNAGGEVREERRRDSDGREIVDVIIERVKQEYATGGFDQAQAARFGTTPSKVRR